MKYNIPSYFIGGFTMDKIHELLNRKNSLERQLENCRYNNPVLAEELTAVEKELDDLGRIEEPLPFTDLEE
jgi:hypothetical protein